jgi:L-lysine 6-transaminase
MINQTHRSSFYNIKVDISRSHGSYLYDLNTKREVLDLFGMYSSLPLGYNHQTFERPSFLHAISNHAAVKVANCEFDSVEVEKFVEEFTGHSSMRPFSHFHFCCTGALAIEAAVKTALQHRSAVKTALQHRSGSVAVFEHSFHGINGYGGLLSSDAGPASSRLRDFYRGWSYVLEDPLDETSSQRVIAELGNLHPLAAVLVEPIQCTAGDRVLNVNFLRNLRALCDHRDIPLIFDEIQTGFGGTGSMWYFEQLGFTPDIVVFGKKTQVSGIMVQESFNNIFNYPSKLEVTWDGDVLDMIRCRFILKEYETVLENVKWRGAQFQKALPVRRVGLLMALDFESKSERDAFVKHMWEEEATIMIPTGETCVRLRPNLAITAAEANDAIRRVQRTMKVAA